MEFFKKEYPDTDVAVDVTYASFGDRLRAIRKEKGMSPRMYRKNPQILPIRIHRELEPEP